MSLRRVDTEGRNSPGEIEGTFYRVMPDPQLPFFVEDDLKFVREREAKRALIGISPPQFTDAVEFKVHSTANTNMLETTGLDDFNGQLLCVTITAHPKLDDETMELLCCGYEAKGDGTPNVCYFSINCAGKFTETVWLVAPIVAMIHDFAITKDWQWDPNVPFCLGVLHRRGASGSDVQLFRAPNAFPGRTVNAYEDGSGDLWPDANGNVSKPEEVSAKLVRFTFDPRSANLELPEPEIVSNEDCEFSRIDDRLAWEKHAHSCFHLMDPRVGADFPTIVPKMGGGHPPYNSSGHLDYNELHIVDTRNFKKLQAVIELPIRLRACLHGNWVDAQDVQLS
ncbi:hypothetical protein BU26DRAFT_534830 [Trematosphaeria pertusa]|uniref:Carotenoid oxygenase n=1 Tax=Trematosphaeria pertusa TaxID=390896 RepID=A0A6A6HX15_9PLEO|nr:uncharacterized protein BU26DRAFT_534830 [Trematosphaeria pertusa]KAF2242272.1 hypothetical protein BU26DRAFT_534830 [Trematosphaeria pertusa]